MRGRKFHALLPNITTSVYDTIINALYFIISNYYGTNV